VIGLAGRTDQRRPRAVTSPITPSARTLHLIDADNILRCPATTDAVHIRATFEAYRIAASFKSGDHAVVATGCNGHHVLEVELAWPGAQYRRRRGPNGADLELLDALEWAVPSRRYTRVVLGSGDGIFADSIERCLAAGIAVDVVAHRDALSASLARSARGRVVVLPTVRGAAA
jgi:hypothetical protein